VTPGVPPAVGRYATYLRARTGLTAVIGVNGGTAMVTTERAGVELCIAFIRGAPDWQVSGIEVTRDGKVATFTQGQLASAIAALLDPSPAAPAERRPGR
jgi:pyrrolidone-carboxylate peptidase